MSESMYSGYTAAQLRALAERYETYWSQEAGIEYTSAARTTLPALLDRITVLEAETVRITALEAETVRLGRELIEIDPWKLRPMSNAQHRALYMVIAERGRQEQKWGEQNHDPFTYLAILTEEVGELAQAALHARFGGTEAVGLTTEAIHTAAVALAIVECLLREKWAWPGEVAK